MPTPLVTNVRTSTTYPTIEAAINASQKGDTLNIQGSTDGTLVEYNEPGISDTFVDWDLNLVVVGNARSARLQPFDAVNNIWHGIDKGALVIGQVGTNPNVTIDGLWISRCCSDMNNGVAVTVGPLSVQPGTPDQLRGGDAAAIRYQAGNLTLKNCLLDFCCMGILAVPFEWGTGTVTFDGCEFAYNGTGGGQQHNIYIGHGIQLFQMTNCNSHHSIHGQNVKTRAAKSVILNNTIGTTDADDMSNNQVQSPDGGDIEIGFNTIKKGPASSNPYPIEVGGVVAAKPNAVQNIHDNTFEDEHGVSAFVWNLTPFPALLTTNTLTSTTKPQPPMLNGLGSHSGNTWNGAAIPAGSGTKCMALDNLIGAALIDLSGTSGPQSAVAKATNPILGGPGRLTVTGATGAQVIAGPGGADVTVTGEISFASAPTYAPSNVHVAMPVSLFAYADGDTITVDSGSLGYVMICARNVTVNSMLSGEVTIEMKRGAEGVIPSGTVVQRGAGGNIFIDDGGTVTLTGTSNGGTLNGMASTTFSPDALATFIFNDTLAGIPYTGTLSGQAYGVSRFKTGKTTVNSYTSATSQNIFSPGAAGLWDFNLQNDTLDYGPSVGVTASTYGNVGENIAFAAITGSASGSLTIAGSGVVQIIGGHSDGGSLSLGSYSSLHAPIVQIALIDVTAPPAVQQADKTWTLTASNGTTLTKLNVAPNLTAPAAANDVSVTVPATFNATIGVPTTLPLAFLSPYAFDNNGFVKAKVTTAAGVQSFVGRPVDVLAQLIAAQFTFAANDTAVLDFWNQAAVHASGSIAVTAVPAVQPNDIVLSAPASLTLDSGTTAPIPGLSVSDPWVDATPGATSTETLAATTGTVTPASTAGSTSAVNTALAGAQYTASLVGGTDTIQFAGSNSGSGTASASIPATINWAAAWNDIQLTVPGAQTILAGQSVSFAGSTITDALATQAGVNVALTVTNAAGTVLLTFSGTPAAAQTALDALSVPYAVAGADTLNVKVSNPASFSATGTVAITINPAEVDFPSTGGTFTENSTDVVYKCTGATSVHLDLTGQGNTVSCGTKGTLYLTDHSGSQTLVPPSTKVGFLNVNTGSLWATYALDLRGLMTATGWVAGQDPSTVLQVTSPGTTARLRALIGGVWSDKLVFNGTPIGLTLAQLLASAILS